MHQQAYNFVQRSLAGLPDGPVLEIGSLNINGSVRELFIDRAYLGIDRVAGPGVQVVADGATFEPTMPPAVVVCCEVLEHTPDAEAICRNACKALQPGGVFIVTAAGVGRPPHSAVDGGRLREGEFYRNVFSGDIESWLSDFASFSVEMNPSAGDIYAVARKAAL